MDLYQTGYSGFDSRPLYNSADASLLLFEAVYKYLQYTNDIIFVKGIYTRLKSIIKAKNWQKHLNLLQFADLKCVI